MNEDGSKSAKDNLSRWISIVGIFVSLLALSLNYFNSRDDIARQKKIDEIKIRQDLAEAFDLMGGSESARWVHAHKINPTERQRLEKARELIEDNILILNDKHQRGLEMRGIYLARIGKIDEAISQFKQITEIYPDYYKAYCNLGTALAEKEQYAMALKSVTQCLNLNPDCSLGHNLLGVLLGREKNYRAAEREFNKAVEIDPFYSAAYNNLGNVMHELNEHEQEEKAYRKVIETEPSYYGGYYNLCCSLIEQKRYSEAQKMREAAELHGFYPALLGNSLCSGYMSLQSEP